MQSLSRDIHILIISTLNTIYGRDVRSIGRLSATCRYFHALIDINNDAAYSIHMIDARDRSRRKRLAKLRQYNPLNELMKDAGFVSRVERSVQSPLVTVEVLISYPIDWDWKLLTLNPNINISSLMFLIEMGYVPKCTNFHLKDDSPVTREDLVRHGIPFSAECNINIITTQEYLEKYYSHESIDCFMMFGRLRDADIEKYADKIAWNYDLLLCNNNLSTSALCKYRDSQGLPKYTRDEITRFGRDTEYKTQYFAELIQECRENLNTSAHILRSAGGCIPPELILQNLDLPWPFDCILLDVMEFPVEKLSSFPAHIRVTNSIFTVNTIGELIQYPNSKFHDMYVAGTLDITVLLNNPHIKWDWKILLGYENIHVRDFLKHFNNRIATGWWILSERSDISIDVIRDFPKIGWCTVFTSLHNHITADFIAADRTIK